MLRDRRPEITPTAAELEQLLGEIDRDSFGKQPLEPVDAG